MEWRSLSVLLAASWPKMDARVPAISYEFQPGGRRNTLSRMSSFSPRTLPVNPTQNVFLHPLGQHLVARPHSAAKETEERA